MSMHRDADLIRDTARRFITLHIGEHLHRDRCHLVDRCAKRLTETWEISHERAVQVSVQMLGEVEAKGSPAYVDLNRTTSHAVFVSDPANNRVVVFTAADLLAMARHPAVTHALALSRTH